MDKATADAIFEGIRRTLTPPDVLKADFERMNADLRYYFDNEREWRSVYPNKLVAIHGQRVIASADNHEELHKLIRESGHEPGRVLVEFIHQRPVGYLL